MASTVTDKKLDQLIHSIEILVDVMEKRGRANYPSSMLRYINRSNDNDQFLRDRSGFNFTDFTNLMNEVMNELKQHLSEVSDDLNKINKKLRDRSGLTLEEIKNLQDKQKELIKEQRITKSRIRGGVEKEYDRRHRESEKQLRSEYSGFTKDKQKIYGSADNYVKFKQEQSNFEGRSVNRSEASGMINESGLGNTAVGRFGQSLISKNQQIDEIGNFGKILQNGGAEKLSSAMFGGSKGATSALSGMGKGLSVASKALGPFAIGLQVGIEAIKLFAQVLGAANAYITRLVNMQTDLNEMSFQKTVDINNLINERQVEAAKYIGETHLKQVEIQGQNLIEAVSIATKQFVKATEIAVGPLTKGVNETAYDAANAYIDYQADIAKQGLHQSQREGELERFQKRRGIEYENFQNVSSREEERVEGKYNYDTQIKLVETAIDANNDLVGRFSDFLLPRNEDEQRSLRQQRLPNGTYSDNAASVYNRNKEKLNKIGGDSYLNPFLDMFGAGLGDKVKSIYRNALQPDLFNVEWEKQTAQWQSNLTNTIASLQEQAANKEVEIATEVAEKYIEASAEAKKMWLQLAQKTEQWLDKFDQVTNDLGVSLGYTNSKQLEDFQNTMFEASKVASKFGKSFEEVVKMQQGFVESTGRNRMFSEHDYGQMLGLGKYLGDDGLAVNYASEMEIFNIGVADSVDILDNVLQDVNRIGLNGRKYTKTLVDSLKLAQKYNFKGGTENLMKMAKWAENTRFNMNSLGGMLDKVSEGGLEGVITQGAQFQVLGGHAAMNADPIAMMYERYADPEALVKRMQDMTKGYGHIDRKTGETNFAGNEIMMMEQLAKVQGRSVEDVMNEVRARNKREVVAKQLNDNFDEDEQSLVSNLATYNKKTGQFQVKVKQGNTYVDKDVSQLTKKDLVNLMPEKHDERMEDYMQTVIDYLAKMTGEENLQKTMIGQALNEDRKESYLTRLQTAHENFTTEFETYVKNAKEGMHLANEKFSDYIKMWQNNNDAQGPGLDQINAATSNIASALDNTANIISEANQKIKDSVERAKFGANSVTGRDENSYLISVYSQGGKIPKPVNDGVINNNNRPILAQANNVTKVQDGTSTLVQSDSKDTALFAKDGGPFDTLFNGIFNKVEALYDAYSSPSVVSSDIGGTVREQWNKALRGDMPMSSPSVVSSDIGGTVRFDTLKIEMSGNLELSSGGQSVDIMKELQTNPMLLRALSQMMAEHISQAMNGGRGTQRLNLGSI